MKHLIWILLLPALGALATAQDNPRWPAEKAAQWYAGQPWLVGCDFIPSTAINQLEMWQGDTYDAQTIDRELGYAEGLGFNIVRVYLHLLVWEADADAFFERMDHFLEIADRHHIATMFVFFDDCWNPDPQPGKQPEPKPGLHNSGWVQCPGAAGVTDITRFPAYEKYVRETLTRFKDDPRIILWDLYNEPGNSGHLEKSLPLLKKVFEWAQAVRPSQPISAGVWNNSRDFARLNAFQLNNSDVITFHNYDDVASMKAAIDSLRSYGRPLICTEYMRRPVSNFQSHLPLLHQEKVGAINWGLVNGKTQTIYPWETWQKPYEKEPEIWFHDIFEKDGTPYKPAETALIRSLSGVE